MKKVFLINVGVNTSYEPLKSPIFENNTFLFVPIPEDKQYEKLPLLTFKNIFTSNELKYIPLKYHNCIVHNDPEFKTFTYGDNTSWTPRASNLKYTEEGDLFFFFARLVRYKEGNFTDNAGFYLIGFFEIGSIYKEIYDITKIDISEIQHNAHVIRSTHANIPANGFWVFKGNDKSRLFKYAVPFDREIVEKIIKCNWDKTRTELQIIGSYTRSCRIIKNAENIYLLREWVKRYSKEDI